MLELVELGDAPRLDELDQARLDRGPDASQVPDATAADELAHRGRRRAQQLGRPAIRTDAVVARTGEVEQRREPLELLGDARVVERYHGGSVSWRCRP